MLKKLLNGQSKTIASAAFIIGAASLISRVLGVFRDRVLAGEFGAGIELDMYYAAFRIPDLVFNLVVLGAVSAGFIPVFTQYLKSEQKAWELVNVLLNAMILALIIISGGLILLAPWLVKIIAPGFSPAQLAVTAQLTAIMFLSPIFLGISAILGGVLQSYKRFFVNSLAPILYNVGIILGALFFVPLNGIYGLAWGVVLGAVLHMAIQILPLLNLGYKYRLKIDLYHKGFLRILKMTLPRILSLVISQINLLVVTIIGSTLAIGSITIFNLANNLQSLPLGVFGVSFAIAAFPSLAELADRKKKFLHTLSAIVRQILFLIIPASALLIILRAQIVRVVLGTGKFDWQDTVLTLETLSLFAFSLFAQALILLFIRAFYALEDAKTPFYIGLVTAFANIVMAIMLVEKFSVAGLALAFSLSSILNFILLILAFHYRLGQIDGTKIVFSAGKILVDTFMLALVAQAAKYLIEPFVGTQTFVGIAIQTGLAAGLGLAAYLLISRLLNSEELNYFTDSFRKKLIQKSVTITETIENE